MSFLFTGCKSLVESLERRLALGAPLALTDEGLALSAPGEEAWLDPGINESEFSSMNYSYPGTPPPPPPGGGGTMPPFSYSTGRIVGGYGTAEGSDPTPPPGSFRFEVTTNNGGLPMPSSATMSFSLSGSAGAGVDYSGPLTSGSVTVPLDASGYGFKDVEFSAIDDDVMESIEDVIPTITGGSVNSGTFSGSGSWMAMLKSDDGTAANVTIDLTRGGATAKTETGQAEVPDGTALVWKVGKVTTGAAGTSATGEIKITKSTPRNIGAITDNDYTYEGSPIPAGTSKVYDVEIKTDGGGNYKAKLKVTVKN